MVVECFPLDGEDKAPTLASEGVSDHKNPVANSLLRRTGFYKLVGRMIVHSFIHKGPPIFCISQAIIDYMSAETKISTLEAADICDIDLRKALFEVRYNNCLSHLYQFYFFMHGQN